MTFVFQFSSFRLSPRDGARVIALDTRGEMGLFADEQEFLEDGVEVGNFAFTEARSGLTLGEEGRNQLHLLESKFSRDIR